MKKIILFIGAMWVLQALAQNPDDALRTSWFSFNGTARNIATGGVMGSLGGDITAAHVNPAGLGLFKTGELVISPGFKFNNNRFAFRGTDTTVDKNNFNYGTMGVVWGVPQPKSSKWASTAFALSVNQLANYNNHVQFKGFNNFSSFTEQYLEELVYDRADTNAALSNYIFGSSLAFRAFLIDTVRGPSGQFAGYQSLVPITTGVIQEYNSLTRGGYHEIAISSAANLQDKLYIGGSLTIPVVYYKRQLTYSEKDATNNTNNDFSSFTFSETNTSTGIGIGAKLGFIYKPQERWRLGFALHTPQYIAFTDKIRAALTANTESYAGTRTVTSDELNSGNAGERKYYILTPYRAIASASYVFREIENTKKQRAFLSADIEFVNYRGARYSAQDQEDIAAKNYLKTVNSANKEYFKGNFNVRLGGELKLHTIMFRLGGAYYGSPYKDKTLKGDKLSATGGIGYRDHGIFIDIAYAHTWNNDVVFPYRLNDKPDTFASQSGSIGSLMLTFGFKF